MDETVRNWQGLSEAVEAQSNGSVSISYDFSYADALEILRLVDTTPNVRKLSLAIGDLKVEVEREASVRGAQLQVMSAPTPQPAVPVSATPAPANPAPVAAPVAASASTPANDAGLLPVRSPIAGIFYRAPAPGEPPFVEVGSQVDEDTVIGIIEVMKVMNNIRAGGRGVISEICADNEELVQFDQTLFYVEERTA